jgi:uncharacterized protein (DUF1499 family)
MVGKIFLGLLGAVLLFAAYVRLAPSNPESWHVAPDQEPHDFKGSYHETRVIAAAPMDVLDRLDTIARAWPRTRVLAGSVDEALVTYITRTKYWGFPDYTTVQVALDADDNTVLSIHARLRFGGSDGGVNRARVRRWLKALDQALSEAR